MSATASSGPPATSAAWLEDALGVLDAQGHLLHASDSLRTWLGLPLPHPQRTSFWDLLEKRCPDWRPTLLDLRDTPEAITSARLSLPAGESSAPQWFQLERAQHAGSVFVRIHSILPSRSELSEAGWDAHLDHAGARRELYMRLLRAEAQLERLTDYWPGVIFSQRPDFSFEFVSPKIEVLTGVPPTHWQRQPQRFWQVVHEADAAELQQQYQHAARSGRPVTNTFRLRHVQSGRVSYVLEHRQPMVSRGGLLLGYEGVWLDVTRQTIAERRLLSAAWKETLAVLTMGLAHDFGNIMAGIHSLSESFLDQIESDHPFREGLSLIQRNSMQASQLVHRIINLHLGKTGDRNYHDLNEIISEIQDLVRKIIARRIQISVHLSPCQLPLYVDAVEFRQTIINLALNAAEAMPEKGCLQIHTAQHTEWPAPAHVQGVVPRLPCVRLSVRDNGCGINPRHLDAIFDPFFTTKSANKGSGLGLYNARLFVEKHRGAISVESVEGQGTTFHIWLPQADFSEAERQAASQPAVPARRLSLVLLGAPGRRLNDIAELLRTGNYHVTTVQGTDAAEAALRSGDCIYSGLVVLLERDEPTLTSFLVNLRRQVPQLKLIVKATGCNRDELRVSLVRSLDLAVCQDTGDQEFLAQLREILQPET